VWRQPLNASFPDGSATTPADRDQYAALKQALRESGIWGHDYTTAKAAFVN
jgi:hypothetical protein